MSLIHLCLHHTFLSTYWNWQCEPAKKEAWWQKRCFQDYHCELSIHMQQHYSSTYIWSMYLSVDPIFQNLPIISWFSSYLIEGCCQLLSYWTKRSYVCLLCLSSSCVLCAQCNQCLGLTILDCPFISSNVYFLYLIVATLQRSAFYPINATGHYYGTAIFRHSFVLTSHSSNIRLSLCSDISLFRHTKVSAFIGHISYVIENRTT